VGDPAEIDRSAPPVLLGLPNFVTLDEADANAGTRLLPSGALALSDADSAELAGGRIRLERIVTDPVADGFLAPDDAMQDNLFVAAGGAVSVAGSTIRVDGVDVATVVGDGQAGADLALDLLAGATLERVETLLAAISYQTDSDDPRASRTYSLRFDDGDGGLSEPRSVEVRVTPAPETGAPERVGGEAQVNAFTPGDQDDAQVAALGDGGWVVVWTSAGQDAGDDGVFAQRFSADGNAVGGELRVNAPGEDIQRDAAVTALADGGWVVVWEARNQDNGADFDFGVFAQRFGVDGAPAGGGTQVNTTVSQTQFDPAVATIPDGTAGVPAGGGYVVVFTSDVGDGSSDGVLLQRFATDGTPLGTETVVNTTTSGNQGQPDVAVLADGRIAVTWSSSGDVFARILDADGTESVAEFLVNTTTASTQDNPSIGATADGGFVIAWEDSAGLDGSGQGIVAQRFDATATAQGGEFVVNEIGNSTQGEPDVVGLDDGRFVIAWTDFGSGFDGSGAAAVAQVFAASGERLDGQLVLNGEASSNQSQPALAALPGGNFVAAWTSVTSGSAGDGSGNGVFQQIFGTPADFDPGAPQVIEGLAPGVTIGEADANAGLVRIDPDKTVALGDLDSPDFDGGTLTLAVDQTFNRLGQLGAPDDPTQDGLGIVAGDAGNGDVQTSGGGVGDTVSVDGTVIGTITSDGAGGQPLAVTFNAAASIEAVEALLGNLGYRNDSDAPAPLRRLSLDLTDGDGQSSGTAFVDVTVTPHTDSALSGGAERRVNAHTEIEQNAPHIVELAGGGHVVVWQSRDQDNRNVDSDFGIFAQRYDAAGVPVGREMRVNTTTASTQSDPAIAATGDGGFVVVWEARFQDDPGSSDLGIVAQRFDAGGAAQGGELVVNTTVAATQFDPAVAAFAGGGFVVTWTSDSGDGSSDAILSQRFLADGTPDGPETLVNTVNVSGNQSQSDVAGLVDAGGTHAGHVVVFTAPSSGGDGDGSSNGVFAQRFDASGAAAGAEFRVNTTTDNSQSDAAVTGLAGGGFVVVWTDAAADGSGNGVFAQRFDASGAAAGAEFRVNTTTDNSQSDAAVTGLADGGFLVSWTAQSSQDGSGDGVFAQRFAADGSRVDGEVQVNQETSSTQDQSAVASAGDGFAAVWRSVTSNDAGDGSGDGVFLRRFESAPAPDISPDIGDAERVVQLFADDVTAGAQILDDAVAFSDPDSADFDGGRLEVYYTAGATATDQLSIAATGPVTITGAGNDEVRIDGVQVGTIDATANGANGAALVIDLNADAGAAEVKILLEHVAYGSTGAAAGVANTERGIGFLVTDGDGGQSEPDSILLDINSGSGSPSGIAIDDWGETGNEQVDRIGPVSESALITAPIVIDGDVDLDDFEGGSFDGGFILLDESGSSDPRQQLSVRDQGNGAGEVGFDGTTVSFGGVAIGTVNGSEDGADGANLRIDLNAAATAGAIEAVLENLTYGLSGATTDASPDLRLSVGNQAGTVSNVAQTRLDILPDAVEVAPASSPEQQVNTFTEQNQLSPQITPLADGGYVVAWTSEFQDDPLSSSRGVFAQRYNAQGAQVGAEFQINDQPVGDQVQPRLAGLDNGSFVALWTETGGRDGSSSGVFGRVFDAGGVPLGGAFQVNEQTSSSQDSGQVVDLGGGRFLTTWTSQSSGPAGDGSGTGIFGRVFDATGTPEGGEFQINSTTASNQVSSRAVALPDGDVMVVWEDQGAADGSSDGIFAQRLDADGNLVSFDGATPGADERGINTTTAGAQDNPGVAALAPSATLPGGGFVFVWESADGSGDGIFAQVFDIDGVAQGGELRVNTAANSTQSDAAVVGTPDGGFAVIWTDSSGAADSSGAGVVAQRFNADGSANGPSFLVNTETASTQSQPEIAALANGTLAAVWASSTSGSAGDGSRFGVFQALFDAPPLPAGAADPVIEGVVESAVFDEAAVNAAPQRLDRDGALSLTDMDSADFDGGSILLARVVGSGSLFDARRGAGEGPAQDQLSIADGNGVTVSADQVSVDGAVIGTIVQDGSDGAPLEVALSGAAATPEAVEAVVAQLAYANTSDDPGATRQLALQISDGDGGSTGTQPVTVQVVPQVDRTALAQGGDEQVNTFVDGAQSNAATAPIYDAGGAQIGYVVVWQSADQDRPQDNGAGIFGQRYDLDGEPVGAEFQVNLHTEFAQTDPAVTGLPTGGFAVAWSDSSGTHPAGLAAGETSSGTFAQVFDADGQRVGSEFLVNDLTGSTQDQVELAARANGSLLAVFRDNGGQDGSGQGIFLRELDATGAALGPSVQVNVESSSSQFDPAIAVLDGGRVVVTWSSSSSSPAGDGSGNGVFARLFETDGSPLGGEFRVNTTTTSSQDAARVAALGDGGFVVVWDDGSGADGSGTAVFQQRFDAGGNAVGGEVLVNETTSGNQFDPFVVGLDIGGWVVAWRDSSGEVFGQRYAADGARVDGEFRLDAGTGATQSEPRLVALPDGGFTALWTSSTSASAGDGDSNGIFRRLFADPANVEVSDAPVIAGLPDGVSFDEAVLESGAQRIAPSLGLGDVDSADFDGGVLTVSMVVNDTVQVQFAAPDDATQDQLGLDTSGSVQLAGSTVSVGGTAIGTLVSDGANGANLTIALDAGATPARVEALLESLTYTTASDDPEAARRIAVQLTDGDGGSVREVVDVVITPAADGGVPVDDEVATNSFTADDQFDSHVAALADGGYVVVWTSNDQDARGDNRDGVFAQRYDAAGAGVGGEIQVNTNAAFDQDNAQVVGLASGGFVVAWQDRSGRIGDDNDQEIAFQIFDADGQKVGGEVVRDAAGVRNPFNPALTAFDNGDFLLVHHAQDTASFTDKILGQRFDDQGGAVGAGFEIAPPGSNGATSPDAAVQSDGSFVVVFTDRDVDNPGDNDLGVFLQRFAADGSSIGGPIQVNTIERASQFEPRVAATEDGGYVVVYRSDVGDDAGVSAGIFAQRFDGAGNEVGGEFLVNEVVDGSQFQPDVAAIQGSGGGFAVVYTDGNATDGSSNGVFVQQYDAQGRRIDGPVQVNQAFSSRQDEPALAALPGGNLVVSFTSVSSGSAGDGSGDGIFHRIVGDPGDFASDGEPVLDGVNRSVTYAENTLNGVPQLIDANGAAAVSDPDSADFDGGSILVSNVIASAPLIDQINPPDDLTQDQLGLRQGERITIAGSAVSVDGTEVAQIVQDGQSGRPFELALGAGASAEVVELLVENLTYRNVSDDPLPVRELRIQITDGDGGASQPQLVTVNITPTPDAATPVGGERTVNTTDTGTEDNPAVATLPGTGGDFVVVWESFGSDGDREGIFAQRFDVNGNKLARDGTGLASGDSDEFQVNTTTAQDQFDPQIAAFSTGAWVVTWTDDSLDGSGQGVVAQIFDPDGTPNGAEFVVNPLNSSTQSDADVAVLGDDSFVVVWESANSGGAGDGDGTGVIARHFAADGTPLSGQFVVNTEAASTQSSPSVTPLNDGGFLVTWESFSTAGSADGERFGVFAQRFDAGANAVGGEFQVNSATNGDQFAPQVAVLADGNLVVTWTDDNNDLSGNGVFAAIHAPDGTPVTEEFRVNDQRLSSQSEPDVTALDTGGFVIVWSDSNATDGSSTGVFAQQYDANGNRLDSQFQVNTTTSGAQNQPAVDALPGGGFVVTFNGSVLLQIFGNESPTISPVSAVGDEDTPIVLDAAIFDAGFDDPDGNTLQAIRIETFPDDGTLTLSGTPVTAGQVIARADLLDGNLVYTGNQDFNGDDDFLWTGSDGIAFSSDPPVAANITVNPVNDPPGLEAGADTDLGEGGTLNRTLTLTDPDVDDRSFTVDFGDGSPVVSFDSTSLSPAVSHTFGGEGVFTVSVTVDDNAGETNSVEADSFTVTVLNAAPNASNDFVGVSEDGPASTGDVLANDDDPGGDPISVSAVNGNAADVGDTITLASGALLTLDADGSFSYDPNGQFEALADFQNGSDNFTYQISDGDGGFDTATVSITIDGQNDAPIAAPDDFTANNDSAISGNVLDDNGAGPDSDVDDSSTLSVTEVNGSAAGIGNAITLPSGAALTLNGDGTFDYDPTGAFPGAGSDSFEYTVSDGRGGTDTGTVSITINATNQDPVAQDDALVTDEESVLVGDVLDDNGNGADSDPDGDALTVTRINGSAADVDTPVTLAGGAVVTLDANGSFSLDPDGRFEFLGVGETANESFTYTVEDGEGGSDTATATVTITGVNDAPVAVGDSATTDQDSTVAGAVLGNDTDVDGDSLVVSEVGGSTVAVGVATATAGGGTIVLNDDGTYSYDPNGTFDFLDSGDAGFDTIQYTVSDGESGTDTATLTITVNGLNDAPTARDDALNTFENDVLVGDLTADNGNGPDSDPDQGDVPFVTEVNGDAAAIGDQITLASGALLTVNGSGAFTYDPNGQFDSLNNGESALETFQYTLQDDSGATDTATVTITIDGSADAPVAADDAVFTDEDTAVSGDVLSNDQDADGDPLTVSAVNGVAANVGGQVALTSGALLTLNGDGTFDYDPNGQFEALAVGESATDTFTYTVDDGNGGTDTATVTVTIDGANDGPDARDDTLTTNEDAPVTAADLLANNGFGVDRDVDGDSLTISAVNGSAADVGTPITLASGALLTVGANGSTDYDPNGQFEALAVGESATDTFTYTIDDGNGGTDTATVSVIVTGVNDVPVAEDDSAAVAVDVVLDGDVLADNGNGPDRDPDASDVVTVTALDGSPAALGTATAIASGALVTLNADGTFAYDQNGVFTGLAAGATATDTFTYTISDDNGGTDTATVTITIGGANLPPVARDDALTTTEDDALTASLLADNGGGADSDPNGDPLTVSAVNGSAANVGTAITLASGALLTVGANGSADYDPNGQFEALAVGESAADTFTYTVSDGNGGTDTATVTVTVDGVNDAPVARDDALLADEDTALSASLLDDNGDGPDVDRDGDPLRVSAVNGSATSVGTQITLASGALLTVGANGSADYDPNGQFEALAAGDTATDTFTYTVDDGNGGADTATVTVTIDGVNDAPLAVDDALTTDEDSPRLIQPAELLVNDTDVDTGDVPSVAGIDTSATIGTVTDNGDGTFTYDPNGQFEALAAGESATDTFTYTISDGNGGTDTATVTVTVEGVNDAPVAVDDAIATVKATPAVLDAAANDTDAEGDPLDAIVLTQPANGLALLVDTGIAYVPDSGFTGSDSFDYTVFDGNGGTDSGRIDVDVLAPASEIDGTPGRDLLLGTPGDDVIRGEDGIDRIAGGSGNDTILGGPAIDLVNAGAGDDIVFGGLGRDIVLGGAGADLFVIGETDHFDFVRDFQVGTDQVLLTIETLLTAEGMVDGTRVRGVDTTGDDLLLQVDVGAGFQTIANLNDAAGSAMADLLFNRFDENGV